MVEDVDTDRAVEIAKAYADEECVGEVGEIVGVEREDDTWIVEVRTHTFADSYDHRLRITSTVGNVISHDRIVRRE